MKTYIRRREKNNQLLVVYGGWGSDENIYVPMVDDDYDFILFYNYSADEPLILPEMKTYQKVTLVGFSLGVFAASYLSPKSGITPDITIAINGTPFPVDEKYGIHRNVFEGTLNNITDETIGKFYLRMYGDKKTFNAVKNILPRRTLKSLHDELRWLYNRIMEADGTGFKWNYAITSENDRVFPSESQKSYWSNVQETEKIVLPLPHYFFHKWGNFSGFLGFVESWQSLSDREKKEAIKKIKDL